MLGSFTLDLSCWEASLPSDSKTTKGVPGVIGKDCGGASSLFVGLLNLPELLKNAFGGLLTLRGDFGVGDDVRLAVEAGLLWSSLATADGLGFLPRRSGSLGSSFTSASFSFAFAAFFFPRLKKLKNPKPRRFRFFGFVSPKLNQEGVNEVEVAADFLASSDRSSSGGFAVTDALDRADVRDDLDFTDSGDDGSTTEFFDCARMLDFEELKNAFGGRLGRRAFGFPGLVGDEKSDSLVSREIPAFWPLGGAGN